MSPAVDPATLLGLVRVRLGAAGQRAGRRGRDRARSCSRRHDGVGVPPAALRRSAVGADEVVVCDHGVARVRTVDARQARRCGVEIANGVKPGEQVVVDHVLGLEDGQALRSREKPE